MTKQNLRRHSHFIAKQHEGIRHSRIPSYLLYYPVNRRNYPVHGVFWSLTFAAGPDHSCVLCPAVRQASITFPFGTMEVRSLALACPGYRFTLAQFSTNDCSTSYPELSGNTIGRVTRPRVLPLRISPISYDRYVDIIRPCTALHCFSRCYSGSPTASGSANACDRKMLLTYAPTAAVPPTAVHKHIYG